MLIAERIEWRDIEREFTPPYSSTGSLAMPIRFMAGCMVPKHIYNLGDETLVYDREGCGAREIIGVKVITPGKPKKSDTAYDRKKKRYPFRRRADIEPVFGHLKTDHRMRDNFLSGRVSASINAMLAATGWNIRKMMKDLASKSAWTLFALM